MHLPLLEDILILLIFSATIVFVLQRLKIPSIIGFLITGMTIGPYGLSLIEALNEVEIMAEIGVILLLFVIGMELSIKQLASIRKSVFIGGLLQVGLTIGIGAFIYSLLGYSWSESVFIGFLISLSSTAIVLKTLQDRNEISSPHGRNALAILIFQDIIVVPMMLITPLIAGDTSDLIGSIISLIIKSIIVIILTLISARYFIPKLLHAVARTNSKELFLLVTISLCFLVAFLTSEIGLSLALGAFIAGLIISESEYSHQATSIILPFRELFTSFFFVSVGMLLDLSFFLNHIGFISLLVLGVFIIKSLIAAAAIAILKYPPRTYILTGLSLFQVGEFAFILSKVGIQYGLLSEVSNQYFLSVSIVSMMLTPLVIIFSDHITENLMGVTQKIGLEKILHRPDITSKEISSGIENHLVIIGYGINGRNLAKAADSSNIPYLVVEIDADTVKSEKKRGIPIIFGDARHENILKSLYLNKARTVVVAISDNQATKAIIRNIRTISDSLYLIVRTRYVKETAELVALGADDVIPEEFETSIQIFTRVLQNFLVLEEDIERLVYNIRSDNYQFLVGEKTRPSTFRSAEHPDFKITSFRVNSDSNRIIGKSLKDLSLRAQFGINILGIRRKDTFINRINPEEIIKQHDILYVQGNPTDIESFYKLIK